MSEGQEESLVGVACLCVVANLSLTKYCHSEIAAYSSRLFELLEDEDTALLKQVLTILLNLCCERSTVPMLLTAKVSLVLNCREEEGLILIFIDREKLFGFFTLDLKLIIEFYS